MLSSRQLAVIVWLAIFVIWALSVKQVRSAVINMLRVLFSPKIALPFALIIGWNVAVVWGLQRVGFWNPTMLYDTVVFIAVGGIGSVSRAATQGVTYDRRFFLRTMVANFEFIVLFAFLSDFFPFNFWVEFLVVLPLTTLLVLLVVVSEKQEGAEQAHRFLSGAQSFIGLLLIGYVVWKVITEFDQLANAQALSSFLLPFVMSVFFVPLLFLVCTLMAYEDAFLIVSFKSQDKRLSRWKKRRLFLRFGLNLKSLQVFRRSPVIHDYGWVKTKDEALSILKSWTGAAPVYEGDDE